MKTVEQNIMKRVRRIHMLRRFVNKTTLKFYGAAVLFAAITSTVSIANIYANMPSLDSPLNVIDFAYRAMVNTECIVQVLTISLALLVVLLLRDIVANYRESRVLLSRFTLS